MTIDWSPYGAGFYRQIAQLTRDHMRDHMRELLDYAETQQDSPVKIPVPKRFDIATYVGGVVGITVTKRDDFPALALDALTRISAATNENVNAYRYDGQVTGMVTSDNPEVAERQAKGYLTAVDTFCAAHRLFPVPDPAVFPTLDFTILEFVCLRSEHFGAARVEAEIKGSTREVWVDGFRHELAWIVSEPGSGQHG